MQKTFLLIFMLLAFASPAFGAESSPKISHMGDTHEHNGEYVWYRFHFGLGEGDKAINMQEFEKFLQAKIVPIIPEGFTLTTGQGRVGAISYETAILDVFTLCSADFVKQYQAIVAEFMQTYAKNGVIAFLAETTDVNSTLWLQK